MSYSLWGHKDLDMTEGLTLSLSCNYTEEFMPSTLKFYKSYRCSKLKVFCFLLLPFSH